MKISSQSTYHAISSLSATAIIKQKVKKKYLLKTVKIIRNTPPNFSTPLDQMKEIAHLLKNTRETLGRQNSKTLNKKINMINSLEKLISEKLSTRRPVSGENLNKYSECLIKMKVDRERSPLSKKGHEVLASPLTNNTSFNEVFNPHVIANALRADKKYTPTLNINESAHNEKQGTATNSRYQACINEIKLRQHNSKTHALNDLHRTSVFYDSDAKSIREGWSSTPEQETLVKKSTIQHFRTPPAPKPPTEKTPLSLGSNVSWD